MTPSLIVTPYYYCNGADPGDDHGPYTTLAEALAAMYELRAGGAEPVGITGTDEAGYHYDFFEYEGTETPVEVWARHDANAAEADAEDRAEARQMAGMAHGVRGLANFDGLDLDGIGDGCEGRQGCRCEVCT